MLKQSENNSSKDFVFARGVQYVHCVIHKCIMVKVGGNEKHIKYVKNTLILRNQRRYLEKLVGNEEFFEMGGNVLK